MSEKLSDERLCQAKEASVRAMRIVNKFPQIEQQVIAPFLAREIAKNFMDLSIELAELRKDKERLDWLEEQRNFETYPVLQSECTGYVRVIAVNNKRETEGKTFRVAIDAAMREKP